MGEKQASSEIAQSRERFEKWFREGACFPDDLRRDSSGMYYAMGPRRLYEAWEQAERDTRERCAQMDAKLKDFLNIVLTNGANRVYLERVAKELLAELAERIRGKE